MEKKLRVSPADLFIGQELGILAKLKKERGAGVWASSVGGKLLTSVLYLENESVGPAMDAMLIKLKPMLEEISKSPELCQQFTEGIKSEMEARRMGVQRE